jgi:exodeoxyribonuclease VII small subunit
MRKPQTPSTPSPETSFEEAMERLDEIVSTMEGERLALDDMVGNYEEGVRLLSLCRQRIENARQRVERINVLLDGQGKATLSDLDLPAEGAGSQESAPAERGTGAARISSGRVAKEPADEPDDDIRLF